MIRCLVFAVFLGALADVTAQAEQASSSPDVRIQVSLKNGEIVAGVAKGGCVIERLGKGGYETTENRDDRNAGVRVWYYRNLDGFIFLPYRAIADLKVLAPLSHDDSLRLKDAVSRSQADSKPRPNTKSATEERPKKSEASNPAKPEIPGLSPEESKLLSRFPPERGYSASRFGEIQRRSIVEGIRPTADEAEFVKSFTEWERAVKKSKANGGEGQRNGAVDGARNPEKDPKGPKKGLETEPQQGKALPGGGPGGD